MRKLLTAIAVTLFSTAAQAEVHEFSFGGSSWRIEISEKCRDISCVHVSERERPARKSRKEVKSAAPAAKAPNMALPIQARTLLVFPTPRMAKPQLCPPVMMKLSPTPSSAPRASRRRCRCPG